MNGVLLLLLFPSPLHVHFCNFFESDRETSNRNGSPRFIGFGWKDFYVSCGFYVRAKKGAPSAAFLFPPPPFFSFTLICSRLIRKILNKHQRNLKVSTHIKGTSLSFIVGKYRGDFFCRKESTHPCCFI
jgi:hypothetical protein